MDLTEEDPLPSSIQKGNHVLHTLLDRIDYMKDKSFVSVLEWIQHFIQEKGNSLTMEFTIIDEVLQKILYIQEYQRKRLDANLLPILVGIMRLLLSLKEKNIFIENTTVFRVLIPIRSLMEDHEVIQCLDAMDWNPMDDKGRRNLELLVKAFFMKERRRTIRIKVLDILMPLFSMYHDICGDKLLRSTISFIKQAYKDEDEVIVNQFLDLYFWICEQWTLPSFYTMVEYMIQPLDNQDATIMTKRMIANHLNRLFSKRIYSLYIPQCVFLYEKLLGLISHPDYFIRGETVKTLLSLRGTEQQTLIFRGKRCPFLKYDAGTDSSQPHSRSISIGKLLTHVRERIKKEDSSEVFALLIQGIVSFLKNKYILNDIDLSSLLTLLCRLLENRIFGFFVRHRKDAGEVKIENLLLGYKVILCSLVYLPNEHDIHPLIINTLSISIEERGKTNIEDDRLLKISLYGLIQCATIMTPAFVKALPSVLEKLERLMISEKMAYKLSTKSYILDFLYVVCHNEVGVQAWIPHFKKIFRIIFPFLSMKRNTLVYIHYAFQILLAWFDRLDSNSKLLHYEYIKNAVTPMITQNKPWIYEANLDILATMTLLECDPIEKYSCNDEDIFFNSSEEELHRERLWAFGHVLLDIKTNSYGWSRIIMRRPSSKLSWVMQMDNHVRNIKTSLTSHMSMPIDPLEFIQRHIIDSTIEMSETLKQMKSEVFDERSPISPILSPVVSRKQQETSMDDPLSLWYPYMLDEDGMPSNESVLDVPISPRNQRKSTDWSWISGSLPTSSHQFLDDTSMSVEEKKFEEWYKDKSQKSFSSRHSREMVRRSSKDSIGDKDHIRSHASSDAKECPKKPSHGTEDEEISLSFTNSLEKKEMGRSKSDDNVPIKDKLKDLRTTKHGSEERPHGHGDHEPHSEKLKKRSNRTGISKRSSSFSKRLSMDTSSWDTYNEESPRGDDVALKSSKYPTESSNPGEQMDANEKKHVHLKSHKECSSDGVLVKQGEDSTISDVSHRIASRKGSQPPPVTSLHVQTDQERLRGIQNVSSGDMVPRRPHGFLKRQSSQELRPLRYPLNISPTMTPSSSTSSTISVSSWENLLEDEENTIVHPSFIFFHMNQVPSSILNSKMISSHKSKSVRNHIIALDHIYPFETFKVGLLYIHQDTFDSQSPQSIFVQHPVESLRYNQFIETLGEWVMLHDASNHDYYTGDLSESDADMTLVYRDRLSQLAFIVSSVIKSNDTSQYFKDLDVTVVWWDGPYNEETFPGFEPFESQLPPISIWIFMVGKEHYKIQLHTTYPLDFVLTDEGWVTHESKLVDWIRFLSIRCLWYLKNEEDTQDDPSAYIASNFMMRIKKVNEIRSKIQTEKKMRFKHKSHRQNSM